MIEGYRAVDLTHELHEEIPVWPGSVRFSRERVADHDEEGVRLESYRLAGLGTHMDAPLHFVKGGASIDQLKVEQLVAPACVIRGEKLDRQAIEAWEKEHGEIEPGSVVLFHTGWDKRWYSEEQYRNGMHFPTLAEEAADYLLTKGIVGVGIDTYGLEDERDPHFPIHRKLLGAGLYFVENLTRLEEVPCRGAILFALPIRIRGAAEAPARVIALVPV